MKIIFRILSVLTLFAILFTGCGKKENFQEFSWRMCEGDKLEIYLSQHPYSESIIKMIPQFEEKTGIDVTYRIETESSYYAVLDERIKGRSGKPDIYMAGAYHLWSYESQGYVEPLESYTVDPLLTSSEYDFDDFYPTIIHSLRWTEGMTELGEGHLLALPLGFEIYTLAYNKRIFRELGLNPPKTREDLLSLCADLKEFNGPDSFALSLRGTEDWATVHTAYMTLYSNFGAVDLEREKGKWTGRVNSEESLRMNQYWVDLVRGGGPPDWENYDWYMAGAALGDGRAAMLFDADIVGFFQNTPGASREAGNLAWVPPPVLESVRSGETGKSNMWIWSLAMNQKSRNKVAAWLFLQYFTHPEYQRWSAVVRQNVNPPRKSVFEDPDFQKLISQADGYGETLEATIGNSQILFSPTEKNMAMDLIWSRTIRKIVLERDSDIASELNRLKEEIDILLEE